MHKSLEGLVDKHLLHSRWLTLEQKHRPWGGGWSSNNHTEVKERNEAR